MIERMQTHVFSYRHDGRHWQLTLKATDADDARARLGKLIYATYDGVEVCRQPVLFAPVGIAAVWVRNLATRLLKR
jgi:hypothetical protein